MKDLLIAKAQGLLNNPTEKNISLAVLYLNTAEKIESIETTVKLHELRKEVEAKRLQMEIEKKQS